MRPSYSLYISLTPVNHWMIIKTQYSLPPWVLFVSYLMVPTAFILAPSYLSFFNYLNELIQTGSGEMSSTLYLYFSHRFSWIADESEKHSTPSEMRMILHELETVDGVSLTWQLDVIKLSDVSLRGCIPCSSEDIILFSTCHFCLSACSQLTTMRVISLAMAAFLPQDNATSVSVSVELYLYCITNHYNLWFLLTEIIIVLTIMIMYL